MNMNSDNITTLNSFIKNTKVNNIFSNKSLNCNKKICKCITINSSITINNNYSTNNLTCYSNISKNTLKILSQPICNFLNYTTNLDATNNNIDLWQFYRTGDILKIRINN